MALPSRIHFFCPALKCGIATKTLEIPVGKPPKPALLERCRTVALQSILLREIHPFTRMTPLIVDSFNKHLSFYVTTIHDPRFDILTPPKNLFKQRRSNVKFEFFDHVFSVGYGNNSSVAQEYSSHYFPIIESLETGIMTRNCVLFLKRLIKCDFSNGFVTCQCTDFRFTRVREFTTILAISADALPFVCENHDTEEALEREMELLKMWRPIVCTDPSPDVARVQSAYDFRKKMWSVRKERTRTEEVARAPPVEKVTIVR
jgi:hypothetical protein